MAAARHLCIAVVDIERFGARSDQMQSVLRRRLRELLDGALEAVGVVDRGDGVAVLIDPLVGRQRLTVAFVTALREELRRYGVQVRGEASIRLRLSLHAGEVSEDRHGFSGTALNAACRVVDHQALRDLLASVPDAEMVVALTDEWHRAVVGGGWVDGGGYRALDVPVRDVDGPLHVTVPGHPGFALPRTGDAAARPADGQDEPRAARGRAAADDRDPTAPDEWPDATFVVGGDVVARDKNTTNAVYGDVHGDIGSIGG